MSSFIKYGDFEVVRTGSVYVIYLYGKEVARRYSFESMLKYVEDK